MTDGSFPNVKRWFEAIMSRPSFVGAYKRKIDGYKIWRAQMIAKHQGGASAH